uniref:Uncharacterized protein n=1 Tax=Tanacetum cinerariifolium TaxID=118510 RepID=A0A6L2NHP0_TANCI|nr:hypothetical protein [Tanacetum cinerariifolium]
MFKGVKAFSHVSFDEYIRVALSDGILIVGKEDPMYVETLYGWVVSFDEVLVADAITTNINKFKIWFSLENNSVVSEFGEDLMCLLKN